MSTQGEEVGSRFFVTQGVAAALCLLAGLLAVFSSGFDGVGGSQPFFEMMGVIPGATEWVLDLRLNIAVPLLGVAFAVVIGVLAAKRKPRISLIVAPVLVLLLLVPTSVCVLSSFALRYGRIGAMLEQFRDDGPPGEPGKTAHIAKAVVKAIQESVARGVGTVETPHGPRAYFVLAGPGLPKPPGALPPYEEARRLPGCVVLPWGPEGNVDWQLEAELYAPSGVVGGIDPDAMHRGSKSDGQRRWLRGPYRYLDRNDAPAALYPATIRVGDGPYSYGFVLRRSRLDTNDDGEVSRGPDSRNPSAKPADPHVNGFVQVSVLVFRDFDAEANPRSTSQVMPYTNTPAFLIAAGVGW